VGVKVDLIVELHDRLNTAIGAGKTLFGVKRVCIGSIEEARKQNDLPIINIQLTGGEEEVDSPNLYVFDNMALQISLIHTKLDQVNNTLYKTSDSTGILFMFEKMLNAIDNDTSDAVNNTFSATTNHLARKSYRVDETGDNIIITLDMTFRTKNVITGAR
tara:strand:- start:1618 stop:2097 length:480 start_codon:yes stop_codon:yes gene_type:complete